MIKTILLATDFSPAAHDAAHYAAALALRLNAKMVIFHVIPDPPVRVTDSIIARNDEDVYLFVQRRLQEEADAVNPVSAIQVETSSRKGSPVHKTILAAAGSKGADIIVAGIKAGAHDNTTFWPETLAALAGESRIPLLLVPELLRFYPVKAIALASEEDIETGVDLHFLDVLRDIMRHFNPRIFAVRVVEGRKDLQYEMLNRPFRMEVALNSRDMEYECIEGNDIPLALTEFIKERGIDLLVAFPGKHSLFATWFFRSITRSLIQRSPAPLLVLPKLPG